MSQSALVTKPRPRAASLLDLGRSIGVTRDDVAILAAMAVLAISIYFLTFPGVDIAVSRLFYRPEAGFFLADNPLLKALRKSSTLVLAMMLLGVIGRLAWRILHRRSVGAAAWRTVFVLATLAIGPGLVVNLLLKGLWGRARPVQIDTFGGEAAFTPVWVISNGCQSNCSFVSGEGSSAAWMVGVLLVLTPAKWRPVVLPVGILYAFALSMNRLAFGGHFLSDILLSWALTALVMAGVYRATVASPGLVRRARRRFRGLQPVPA
ncbi:phosphatase PAP2 family protein [Brevundimonas sp. SL130]|uniref:phosphatase PAP2 family protein n=1 Tax=Brevundimonas sp. SL130 TaxID=2995143 RepID=UPI00226D2C06|nr:phosphatase PAP2 family protein [Brevundimonas sp. SL130]WAC60468.1 phosphatase PAP2 family protein [Brevundimonas sp. SL130]